MDMIIKLAQSVAEAAAPHADRHDLEGSFATEGITAARDLGYLSAPVPVDFGGHAASTADISGAQRVIARACGSTALASAMHLHVSLAATWRFNRGDKAVEPMLKRVGGEHIIITSTGGNDWTCPSTVATPTEGGWRVSGRKTFASLAPMANVASTFAVIGEPKPGADVIVFGMPLTAEGVSIEETWDAAGMRATGSHDIVLDDVFVSEAQVNARRVWGELDRPLLVASLHAWPVIYSTYLGIAEGLIETIVDSGKLKESCARQLGLADNLLRTASWAIAGVLHDLGPDPDPSIDAFVALQQMKRTVTTVCQDIGTIAAELAGGGAFARRGSIDRMIRDLRAAIYHPFTPEVTLVHAGRHRLGMELAPI